MDAKPTRFLVWAVLWTRGREPMAREPDVALLMAAFVKKYVKICLKMIIIWLSQPKIGSLSQKGSRPLLWTKGLQKVQNIHKNYFAAKSRRTLKITK